MRASSGFRASLLVWLILACPGRAGLYCSLEEIAPLPSQWRGFLLDHRALLNVARKPTPTLAATPLRQRYQSEVEKLEKLAQQRRLTADELADLGALHLRLGDVNRSLEILRAAQKEHARHFRINANLGTAWQVAGELRQAEACLLMSVRLSPGIHQRAEEFQLRLVRLRLREKAGSVELDDLFGVKFLNEQGKYQAGKLSPAERKKLPADAVAIAQQLVLWTPQDGRLLWLLAELAAVHGDLKTAAALMDGCVVEFSLRSAELRRRRLLMRDAAEQLARNPGNQAGHEGHAGQFKPRSTRPLVDRALLTSLPAIKLDGINTLPWAVITQTTVDRQYRPTFPKYLRELEKRQVSLTGYLQPLGMDQELSAFLLIEYPVGCWYCEVPDVVAIVYVELAAGKTIEFTREPITVIGTLKLNAKDPEDFLYTIRDARVKE